MIPLVLEAMKLATTLHTTHPHRAEAHALVLAFPTLMLRPLPEGCTHAAAEAEAQRRVALWKAGRFGDLQREALAGRTPRNPSSERRDDSANRAAQLVREGAFGRASALAQSYGLVQDPEEAVRALRHLHPPKRHFPDFAAPSAPARVPPQGGTLIDLYHLSSAIRKMPKRSATHVDGWRWEHLRDIAQYESGAATLLEYARTLLRADVPDKIADFLASATLYPFNKKDEDTVDRLRDQAVRDEVGDTFFPPTRPVAVASVLVRMATSALLEATLPALKQAVGSAQYGIKTPDALDKIIFGVRAAMEGLRGAVTVHLDMKNAFNEVSRERTWQALQRDPSLSPLHPIYRLLYLDREGAMWYYPPGSPTPYATIPSAEGSRQGCVLGNASFCVPFAGLLAWVAELLTRRRESGVPFAYIDDVYAVVSPPDGDAPPAADPCRGQGSGRPHRKRTKKLRYSARTPKPANSPPPPPARAPCRRCGRSRPHPAPAPLPPGIRIPGPVLPRRHPGPGHPDWRWGPARRTHAGSREAPGPPPAPGQLDGGRWPPPCRPSPPPGLRGPPLPALPERPAPRPIRRSPGRGRRPSTRLPPAHSSSPR